MKRLTTLVLLAVGIGGGFVSAAAEVTEASGAQMTVDLEVEASAPVETVVAHLTLPGEPELVIPLLSRGDDKFGTVVQLEIADYQVVFEAPGSGLELSDPHSLSSLGARFSAAMAPIEGENEDGGERNNAMGWLALALAAASLSALAFWALGGEDSSSPDPGTDEEE